MERFVKQMNKNKNNHLFKQSSKEKIQIYNNTNPMTNYAIHVRSKINKYVIIPNSVKFIYELPICNIIIPNNIKILHTSSGYKQNKNYFTRKIIKCEFMHKNVCNIININNLSMKFNKNNIFKLFYVNDIHAIKLNIDTMVNYCNHYDKLFICLKNVYKINLNLLSFQKSTNRINASNLRNVHTLTINNCNNLMNILNNVYALSLSSCYQNLTYVKNIHTLYIIDCKLITNVSKIKNICVFVLMISNIKNMSMLSNICIFHYYGYIRDRCSIQFPNFKYINERTLFY